MKTGIRIHGRDLFSKTDNIWFTCCALHNWLLEIDGLDSRWTEGVQGDWEGSWGLHDESDARRFGVSRQSDLSQIGGIDSTDPSETHVSGDGDEDARVVRLMSQRSFREKLIKHFQCKWSRREVVWPSRNGEAAWEPPESLRDLSARLP